VVAADQLTKRAIEHSIVPGQEHRLFPGVQLVNTRNRGVAFGFLPGSHVGVTEPPLTSGFTLNESIFTARS